MSENKVKFGNKEYLMVEARLAAMVKDHKGNYSLVISHEFEGKRVTATCKLSIGEQVFIDSATEYGTERKTQEKASTHALGRALSMAGYAGSEYGMEAPIASANEMQAFENERYKQKPIMTGPQEKKIRELIKSHHVTDTQRISAEGWLSDPQGHSKESATATIDMLTQIIEKANGLEK